MKIKNFWNREPKPLTQDQLLIERKLMPRLKLMGYLFFALSIASLLFVIFMNDASSPITEEVLNISYIDPAIGEEGADQLELSPLEVLNFYVVSLIFASMGAICFYVAKIKKRELFQELPVTVKEEGEESPSVDS